MTVADEEGRRRFGQLNRYEGSTLYDAEGAGIGVIEKVLVDQESLEPEWLQIRSRTQGKIMKLVPFRDVRPAGDGFRVSYSASRIEASPEVRADILSLEDQAPVVSHYGLEERRGAERHACISRAEAEARGGAVPGPAVGNLLPTSGSKGVTEPVCEDEPGDEERRIA